MILPSDVENSSAYQLVSTKYLATSSCHSQDSQSAREPGEGPCADSEISNCDVTSRRADTEAVGGGEGGKDLNYLTRELVARGWAKGATTWRRGGRIAPVPPGILWRGAERRRHQLWDEPPGTCRPTFSHWAVE